MVSLDCFDSKLRLPFVTQAG